MITIDNIYDDLKTLLDGIQVIDRAGNYILSTQVLVLSSSGLRGNEETWGGSFIDPTITSGKIKAVVFTKVDDIPQKTGGAGRQMQREYTPFASILIAVYYEKDDGAGAGQNSDRSFNNLADAIGRGLNGRREALPTSLKQLGNVFTFRRDGKLLGDTPVHFAYGFLEVVTC